MPVLDTGARAVAQAYLEYLYSDEGQDIAGKKLEVVEEGQTLTNPHVVEAQIPASQFHEQGFAEGETLLLTPRKARVFVAS